MLGPLLTVFAERWGLNDARAGYLFAAQFTGSIFGVMGSTWLTARRGARSSLLLGMAAMAAGSVMLAAPDFALGILAAILIGVGFGFCNPTTNLIIADLYPHRRAAALNLVNFAWGLGAAICPLCVASLVRSQLPTYFLFGLCSLLAVVALIESRAEFPANAATSVLASADSSSFWQNRTAVLLCGLFFLYEGCEAGIGGWIASYAHRTPGGTWWALTPSFFWGALLIGRLAAPAVLRHATELKLSQAGLLVGIVGLLVLIGARNILTIAAGSGLVGLGFSSVFPILIATLSSRLGSAASRVAGVAFLLAGTGGVIFPWLIGFVSTASGSLRSAFAVPLASCVFMLILNSVLSKE